MAIQEKSLDRSGVAGVGGDEEKSAYERGHKDGHGSGWADGKTKAMQEILNTLERRHDPDCGCRPCLVIRACRGDIKVIEALRGVVDLGELPYYPDQVDGIMLISCAEAPEDDDCGIDEDGYCGHGFLCYRLAAQKKVGHPTFNEEGRVK